MSRIVSLEEIKKSIEDRYKRLNRDKRRPSFEYVFVDDIKEVFAPFVKDSDKFSKMTDEELLAFYQRWYEEINKYTEHARKKSATEIEKPEIE